METQTTTEKIQSITSLICVYKAALAQTRQSKDYAELRERYSSAEKDAAFQALRRTNEYHQLCYAYQLKRQLEQQYVAELKQTEENREMENTIVDSTDYSADYSADDLICESDEELAELEHRINYGYGAY